jgi:UDP-N-acetylglucosamine 4-epimerase
LNYGVETIGLRYFNVFGPKQDPNGAYAAAIPLFMKSVLDGKPALIDGDGEQTRDFTFVANAVQANLLAASTTNTSAINQVFNIAGGSQTTVNDLWKLLNLFAGKTIDPVYKEARKGDVRYSIASIQKASEMLNYVPVILFTDALKVTFEWFVRNQDFVQKK